MLSRVYSENDPSVVGGIPELGVPFRSRDRRIPGRRSIAQRVTVVKKVVGEDDKYGVIVEWGAGRYLFP